MDGTESPSGSCPPELVNWCFAKSAFPSLQLHWKSFHNVLVYFHFVDNARVKACIVLYGDVIDDVRSHTAHL